MTVTKTCIEVGNPKANNDIIARVLVHPYCNPHSKFWYEEIFIQNKDGSVHPGRTVKTDTVRRPYATLIATVHPLFLCSNVSFDERVRYIGVLCLCKFCGKEIRNESRNEYLEDVRYGRDMRFDDDLGYVKVIDPLPRSAYFQSAWESASPYEVKYSVCGCKESDYWLEMLNMIRFSGIVDFLAPKSKPCPIESFAMEMYFTSRFPKRAIQDRRLSKGALRTFQMFNSASQLTKQTP